MDYKIFGYIIFLVFLLCFFVPHSYADSVNFNVWIPDFTGSDNRPVLIKITLPNTDVSSYPTILNHGTITWDTTNYILEWQYSQGAAGNLPKEKSYFVFSNINASNYPMQFTGIARDLQNQDDHSVAGYTTVAPEPISSILFVTGGALLAGRIYLRRKA